MQGNCADPFPTESTLGLQDTPDRIDAPPLVPQKPGQCLLLFTINNVRGHWSAITLPGKTGVHPVWLDNLYVRTRGAFAPADTISADRGAWMTNVTVQGSSQVGPAAVWINNAAGMYAEGAKRNTEPFLIWRMHALPPRLRLRSSQTHDHKHQGGVGVGPAPNPATSSHPQCVIAAPACACVHLPSELPCASRHGGLHL